jgi:hypothetical protein
MKPAMTRRSVFHVVPSQGAWSVEQAGVLSNRTVYKAEAVASATKLVGALSLRGCLTQVRIQGETGYF